MIYKYVVNFITNIVNGSPSADQKRKRKEVVLDEEGPKNLADDDVNGPKNVQEAGM